MPVICDRCHERAATVFITKIVNNETSKQSLCESCARARAEEIGGGDMSLGNIVQNLFQEAAGDSKIEVNEESLSNAFAEWSFTLGEFPADEDFIDAMEDEEQELLSHHTLSHSSLEDELPANGEIDFDALIQSAQNDREREREREIQSKRCPKCSMTWDRLRQDGRAGCPACYTAFAAELKGVLERSQRALQHTGKAPRAAEKRQRRLDHLRARRDHQLELLQRRLQECVDAERFEEAAKLRDKIKAVSSTIVSDSL